MKLREKTIVLFIILTLLVSVFTGCSSGSYSKKILGKWKVDDLEFKKTSDDMFTGLQKMLINVVFEPDSIIEFINKEKVNIMMNSINYEWIEKDKIQIGDDDDEDAPILFDVTIDEDSMIFDNQIVTINLTKES
ncbi:MAG: hypothetical protein GX340_05495 [Clostridiales bacterium]|nr:hypothetical protein [Clostridiales bacterium]